LVALWSGPVPAQVEVRSGLVSDEEASDLKEPPSDLVPLVHMGRSGPAWDDREWRAEGATLQKMYVQVAEFGAAGLG